jgi:hypothetical protein
MQKKVMRFYAILNDIGWRERMTAKLELKRGEEFVLPERIASPAPNSESDQVALGSSGTRVLKPNQNNLETFNHHE